MPRHQVKYIVICFTFLFIFNSCKDNSTDPFWGNDQYNLLEEVFRDQFNNNGMIRNEWGKIDTTIKIFYIGFYTEIDSNLTGQGAKVDPSPKFLKRFENYLRPVKKISDCNTLYFPRDGVHDKTTGELGIIFYTGPIRWLSPVEAELEAGWEYAPSAAACYTYRVYKYGNYWRIYYKTLRWVS